MKKRISALLLSVVLCLGMLSITAGAVTAEGTAGETAITVSGVTGKQLCALWGDKDATELLLLFYTNNSGEATITVPKLETNSTYWIGVSGDESQLYPVNIKDTATPDPEPTPTPGTGGGVVSSNVTITKPTNGKVTVSPRNPRKGATVTVTVTPNEGYVVKSLTVKDSKGNVIEVTKVSDTEYTFTMPSGRVTVDAAFRIVNPFTDVGEDEYYLDPVLWAVEKGITVGTSETTFSPNASCTRAQMVTFLWRASGSPQPTGTDNPFTDVAAGEYYYDAVLWAVEKGITVGTSATTFSPDDTVTRAQTVTFLFRTANAQSVTGDNPFTDVADGEYYADAVLWAATNGITMGTSETTFSPNNDCTRAQIVTFLYRQMA